MMDDICGSSRSFRKTAQLGIVPPNTFVIVSSGQSVVLVHVEEFLVMHVQEHDKVLRMANDGLQRALAPVGVAQHVSEADEHSQQMRKSKML